MTPNFFYYSEGEEATPVSVMTSPFGSNTFYQHYPPQDFLQHQHIYQNQEEIEGHFLRVQRMQQRQQMLQRPIAFHPLLRGHQFPRGSTLRASQKRRFEERIAQIQRERQSSSLKQSFNPRMEPRIDVSSSLDDERPRVKQYDKTRTNDVQVRHHETLGHLSSSSLRQQQSPFTPVNRDEVDDDDDIEISDASSTSGEKDSYRDESISRQRTDSNHDDEDDGRLCQV
jgi:hypothetical protein